MDAIMTLARNSCCLLFLVLPSPSAFLSVSRLQLLLLTTSFRSRLCLAFTLSRCTPSSHVYELDLLPTPLFAINSCTLFGCSVRQYFEAVDRLDVLAVGVPGASTVPAASATTPAMACSTPGPATAQSTLLRPRGALSLCLTVAWAALLPLISRSLDSDRREEAHATQPHTSAPFHFGALIAIFALWGCCGVGWSAPVPGCAQWAPARRSWEARMSRSAFFCSGSSRRTRSSCAQARRRTPP